MSKLYPADVISEFTANYDIKRMCPASDNTVWILDEDDIIIRLVNTKGKELRRFHIDDHTRTRIVGNCQERFELKPVYDICVHPVTGELYCVCMETIVLINQECSNVTFSIRRVNTSNGSTQYMFSTECDNAPYLALCYTRVKITNNSNILLLKSSYDQSGFDYCPRSWIILEKYSITGELVAIHHFEKFAWFCDFIMLTVCKTSDRIAVCYPEIDRIFILSDTLDLLYEYSVKLGVLFKGSIAFDIDGNVILTLLNDNQLLVIPRDQGQEQYRIDLSTDTTSQVIRYLQRIHRADRHARVYRFVPFINPEKLKRKLKAKYEAIACGANGLLWVYTIDPDKIMCIRQQ